MPLAARATGHLAVFECHCLTRDRSKPAQEMKQLHGFATLSLHGAIHRISIPSARRKMSISPPRYLRVIVLVGPAGDFPLDDDWSYATSVRTLVRKLMPQ
jgi:hypothetical protein